MPIERHYSLGQAAKLIGINRATLKKWLASDLAIVLPDLGRGNKVLIRETDLKYLLSKRAVRSDWSLLRGGNRKAS